MGDNIFIHGNAITIGCIPIGDKAIEEVYLLAEKCLHSEIPVIISPRDFRKTRSYPDIYTVDWEEELYDSIHSALKNIP